MSEYKENSTTNGGAPNGNQNHRRQKGYRPFHHRPKGVPQADAEQNQSGETGEGNIAQDKDLSPEKHAKKRSRGKRGSRHNRGDDATRARQMRDDATSALRTDDGAFAKAISYTETERDILAREVHEAVAEERIEKAVLESSETGAMSDVAEAQVERVPVEVVGVRFKPAGKVYYFAPDGGVFHDGDTVIVETARGIEFGFVVGGNRTVWATELVSPLKRVLRMATDEDKRHYEENNVKREEAFRVCRDKIEEHKIEMKLVDVEYTFDNNKLLFYFTADGRVDFRELVKDLASVFRTRIELRQIGIRDEAKLMGGLGVCGRPFCCHSFLSDFVQVSIKMAKEQNLSLNSAKISGTCGRLMCCLRYEYDVYEEEIKKTPKQDAVVDTPDGEGVVCEVIPLAGLVRVRFIGNRADASPRLYHRDDVKVKGKMNWKTGNVTYLDETKQ